MFVNKLMTATIPIIGALMVIFIVKRSKLNTIFERIIQITHHEFRMIDIYAKRSVKISNIMTTVEIVSYIFSIFITLDNQMWGQVYRGLVISFIIDMMILISELVMINWLNYNVYLIEKVAHKNDLDLKIK